MSQRKSSDIEDYLLVVRVHPLLWEESHSIIHKCPMEMKKIKQDLMDNTYVDNVMGLVSNEVGAKKFKVESTEIIKKRKFPLG